jgi:hypothetical protein
MANLSSIIFDGVDGQMSISDNNFDGLSAGTIEFWYKAANSLTTYQKLMKKDSAIDIGITQNFGGGNCKIFAEIVGAGNLGELEEANHADGNWHHLAITWDGSFVRGYIDGVYKKRVAQSAGQNNNANTLYLGSTGAGEYLIGNLDDVRISNVARYITETSFNRPLHTFPNDSNTLVLLRCDEQSGTTVVSATGSNNGTLGGGASFSRDVPYSIQKSKTLRPAIFTPGFGR